MDAPCFGHTGRGRDEKTDPADAAAADTRTSSQVKRPWTLLASSAISRYCKDLDDPPASAERVMALRILRDELDVVLEREAQTAHAAGVPGRVMAVALGIPPRQAQARYPDNALS